MSTLWHYYINITFLERMIVKNIIPKNVIIKQGAVKVDNHISRDNIFDYHPFKECNINFIVNRTLDPLFSTIFSLRPTMVGKIMRNLLIYMHE